MSSSVAHITGVRPKFDFTGAAELLRRREPRPMEADFAPFGVATLDDLAKAVADCLRIPRLRLEFLELGAQLARELPRTEAEKLRLVPVAATSEEVTFATDDAARMGLFDWLAKELRKQVTVVLATPEEIDDAIVRLYRPRPVLTVVSADRDPPQVDVSAEEIERAAAFVDRLIAFAVEARASDVHVEATEQGTVVRLRIDGVLRRLETKPHDTHAAIVSRIKVIAQLDIAQKNTPQDGRVRVNQVDLRVSVLPTQYGEKVVMRILDSTRAAVPLSDLDFEADDLAAFTRMIREPYGLLLVTGPTGSGKSTTLYGAINEIRSEESNIVTVEDPIEYRLPGINQVQVNAKRGLTFAGALRSILRQDPNVILVGEIRDRETGAIAAEAALTGHLVMTTLHTNDAAEAITRLTDMGIEPFAFAPALVGVVAQRLARRVCSTCVERYHPSAAELETLQLVEVPPETTFARGRGCSACTGTGYSGRTAIRELLPGSDTVRRAILARSSTAELRHVAAREGFRTLRFAALKKLFAGVTTVAEVARLTRS